jgi:Fe2+ or Zn2+ uptake regulation protein
MLHDQQTTDDALRVLRALARERLTRRQKRILAALRSPMVQRSATDLVRELQRTLGCSPSTVWNNLRGLRRGLLLEYGGNVPVQLTPAGDLVAASLEAQDA